MPHYSEMKDWELVDRELKGDRTAFDALVTKYYKRIYGLCRRILGNDQDADDATQDAFVLAFRGLGSLIFHTEASFASWLFTIARRTCVDIIRMRTRRPQVPLDDGIPGPPYNTADEIARRQCIAMALAKLNDEDSSLLWLSYYEVIKDKDMARVFGISTEEFRRRKSEARQQFRAALREVCPELAQEVVQLQRIRRGRPPNVTAPAVGLQHDTDANREVRNVQ